MGYVLIIGAKSDIAKAIAEQYAKNGYHLYLAGRDIGELEAFSKNITLRTNQLVELVELDILDIKSHDAVYKKLKEKPVGVISAVGYLGNQKDAEDDFNECNRIIESNFTGVISLLNIIVNDFEVRKQGFIVAISSVAGDRGRKSNYMYGAAKAALTTYLSGIRNRLYDANVHVLTVKPGFVATKMTASMDLPQKLTAQPKDVAKDIYEAQMKNKNILYTKWIWRYIMMIIKLIPEFQFKKMSI